MVGTLDSKQYKQGIPSFAAMDHDKESAKSSHEYRQKLNHNHPCTIMGKIVIPSQIRRASYNYKHITYRLETKENNESCES